MIEFGPDNRPFTTIFATGTGHNQADRKHQAYAESLVGIGIGICRKCKTRCASGPGWKGICTRCAAAATHVHTNGPPVATMSINSGTPDPAPILDPEHPVDRHGLDGLEEWWQ